MRVRVRSLLSTVGVIAVLVARAAGAEAPMFTGRVTDTSGAAIPGAMITLEAAEMVPATLTVFSDDTGAYAMPAPRRAAPAGQSNLACTKLGYETVRQSGSPAAGASGADFTLKPTDNVAQQVSASAWLQDLPDTPARYRTVLVCSACHQFPLDLHRATVQSFQNLTLEEREKAWHGVFDRMRMPHNFAIFPDGSAAANLPPEVVGQMAYNLLTREDENAIVPFAAQHFPLRFDEFPRSKLRPGAPLGAGKETVVEEYQLPIGSHVREVTFTEGSPYLWGVDLQKNRMLRLDLTDGSQKWFPLPAQGATGPHTIAGDAEGNVWVSAQENDTVAKFDPREERWTRVYRFGPNSIVHDIALNSRSEVGFDRSGNVWFTLMNKNKLGRLNAETGETAEFELPLPEGADPAQALYTTAVYGAVMTSDRRTVWFSQLNGYLAAFDTEASKVVTKIPFPRGTGPRRMAIDDDDVLWVPLTGAGRLFVYDTKRNEELATYDLPDRSSHPYVAYWDGQRKVVWIGASNANLLYQFDPKTKRFLEFPLPRERAYMRKLSVVPASGDVWTSYAHFPVIKGPSMAVVLRPGRTDSSPQGSIAGAAE
jgi:streptogramin lyase